MKRFLTVLAAFALAGAIYVATAPGGQTAGPSAKQFTALKKQVANLQKDEGKVKKLALAEASLLTDCMAHSVPIDQYGQGAGFASTYGYTWTEPGYNGDLPWLETALDVTPSDDPNALWITGGSAACGTDLAAAVRKMSRLAGIRLPSAPPLHGFNARH